MTLAEYELPVTPKPHRWTFDDHTRASQAGLFDAQRVELIEGELIDMPAQKDPHAWTISRLVFALIDVFRDPYWVKVRATQQLGKISAPEPDIAVLSGPPSPPGKKKSKVLLVIKVSETTLRYDRGHKASLYAKHGIAYYWLANIKARQLEAFRDPARDTSQRFGWGYGSPTVLKLQDHVSPLCKPDASIELSAFLG